MWVKRFIWILFSLFSLKLSAFVKSYDDLIELIEVIEKDDFEKAISYSELEEISDLLAVLARAGLDPKNLDKTLALEKMLAPNPFYLNHMFLCSLSDRSLTKWQQTKDLVWAYKEEILTGLGIAIAIAATVLSGEGGNIQQNFAYCPPDPHIRIPEKHYEIPTKTQQPVVVTSLEYELNTSYQNYPGDYLSFQSLDIHEEITAYRETVSREVDFTKPGYVEQIRGLGSTFAHEMLDAVEELGCFAPSTLNELKTVGKSLLPNELKIPPELMNPSENFQQMISSGHKNIDRFFETNQAAGYTPEAKDGNSLFVTGCIPFPGNIICGHPLDKLLKAGKKLDRARYYKSGRSLSKHGYREGRTIYPKPIGTPEQINEQAQKLLEKILYSSEKQVIEAEYARFGKVFEVQSPGIGGVRYTIDGEFIGFLEPNR